TCPVECRNLLWKLRQERRYPLHEYEARESKRGGQRLETIEKRMCHKIKNQPARGKQSDYQSVSDARAASQNVLRDSIQVLDFFFILRRNLLKKKQVDAVDDAQDNCIKQAQGAFQPDDEEIGYADQKKHDLNRVFPFQLDVFECPLAFFAIEHRRSHVDHWPAQTY